MGGSFLIETNGFIANTVIILYTKQKSTIRSILIPKLIKDYADLIPAPLPNTAGISPAQTYTQDAENLELNHFS